MKDQPETPDLTIAKHHTGTLPGYMPGFGNDFETEALPDALPQGRKLAAKMRLWALCGAAFGHAFYCTTRRK